MDEQNIVVSNKASTKKQFFKLLTDLRKGWQLYIMALPAMVFLFLIAYLPMGGLVIAFKDYTFKKGIWGSDWLDPWYSNFRIIFDNNDQIVKAIRNTVGLNIGFIVAGTIFSITLALCFNEIKNKHIKKVTQSLSFLPYFISTVVVGIFVSGLLSYDNGVINKLIENFNGEKIGFYMRPNLWPAIMTIIHIWKGAGYGAVVYLATISSFDDSYYEAASIDGATRWQQIWHISLPLLRPTVIVLTLLAVGRIMNADFGLFYNVAGDMPTLYATTDVLDTYIYRALRMTGDIGLSSAVGFFQSVCGFTLVMITNRLARKFDRDSALF